MGTQESSMVFDLGYRQAPPNIAELNSEISDFDASTALFSLGYRQTPPNIAELNSEISNFDASTELMAQVGGSATQDACMQKKTASGESFFNAMFQCLDGGSAVRYQ